MVAIKLIINSFTDEYQSKKILGELQILRQLSTMKSNVFTTKLIDVIASTNLEKLNYIFIVMEYVDSDLKKVFNSSPNIEFNEDHVITILYNTLCAMHFLHSANVMHRDIKPANILVDVECQVKLCDFGLSRTVPHEQLIMPGNRALDGIFTPTRNVGFKKASRALSNRTMQET
jgi:mitogen-activated protein kinase 1/3